MNKDQIDGRVKETSGNVKRLAGKAFGKRDMEFKGKIEQATGKAQASFGDIKNDIEKAHYS